MPSRDLSAGSICLLAERGFVDMLSFRCVDRDGALAKRFRVELLMVSSVGLIFLANTFIFASGESWEEMLLLVVDPSASSSFPSTNFKLMWALVFSSTFFLMVGPYAWMERKKGELAENERCVSRAKRDAEIATAARLAKLRREGSNSALLQAAALRERQQAKSVTDQYTLIG